MNMKTFSMILSFIFCLIIEMGMGKYLLVEVDQPLTDQESIEPVLPDPSHDEVHDVPHVSFPKPHGQGQLTDSIIQHIPEPLIEKPDHHPLLPDSVFPSELILKPTKIKEPTKIERAVTALSCCKQQNIPEMCLGLCTDPKSQSARSFASKWFNACSGYDKIIEKCFAESLDDIESEVAIPKKDEVTISLRCSCSVPGCECPDGLVCEAPGSMACVAPRMFRPECTSDIHCQQGKHCWNCECVPRYG